MQLAGEELGIAQADIGARAAFDADSRPLRLIQQLDARREVTFGRQEFARILSQPPFDGQPRCFIQRFAIKAGQRKVGLQEFTHRFRCDQLGHGTGNGMYQDPCQGQREEARTMHDDAEIQTIEVRKVLSYQRGVSDVDGSLAVTLSLPAPPSRLRSPTYGFGSVGGSLAVSGDNCCTLATSSASRR